MKSTSDPKTLQLEYECIKKLFSSIICDLSSDVLRDPVTLPESGNTYDREWISRHVREKGKEPKELTPVKYENWKTNRAICEMRDAILEFISIQLTKEEHLVKCLMEDDADMMRVLHYVCESEKMRKFMESKLGSWRIEIDTLKEVANSCKAINCARFLKDIDRITNKPHMKSEVPLENRIMKLSLQHADEREDLIRKNIQSLLKYCKNGQEGNEEH